MTGKPKLALSLSFKRKKNQKKICFIRVFSACSKLEI